MDRVLAVVTLALSLAALPAQAAIVNLASNLTPGQEVGGSTGTGFGQATMTLDTVTGEFLWVINYTGLTGNALGAHFHEAPAGSNGSVVFGLLNPVDPDVTSSLNDTSPNGSFSGTGTLTSTEVTNILAHLWYINIHTAANGSGEIRGQVLAARDGTLAPVPLPAAVWLLLPAVVGLGLARRRLT